jgi:transcriptional regulator with XRE-family HTH domain
MEFKDRLKERRRILGISQAELAKKVGITGRTVQNYELGTRNPQSIEIAQKLAEALETTVEYLLGNDGLLIADAYERGGAKTARDINALVSEISGLFAGGEIGEDEKDGIMAALNQAYWMAKENNKKYTPKKYKS